VKAIVELQLYKLTGLERHKLKEEYDAVMAEIIDLMDILAKESRVLTIIKDELRVIKEKYATPRLTDFADDDGEITTIDLIANESQIITISHRGYIKRTVATEFRSQRRGGKGLKGMETGKRMTDEGEEEQDFVEHLFTASSHDWLMFFTNTGRVYAERVYLIPEGSRTSKGRSIKNLLNLKPEEKVASVLRIPAVGEGDKDSTWDPLKFVVFATHNGVVKRTNLSEFRNIRKDGINAINIEEGDYLIGCALTNGSNELILVTRDGLSIRFKEEDVRDMGRTATGVWGIRPAEKDYVVSLAVVESGATLLVASENGIGKRSQFDEYRIQSRGGKGIITMKTTEKTGLVVGALVVHEADEVMLMTNTGQSVRIPVGQIREAGRNTQGVKLISLREGELLQDIARVISDGDAVVEGEVEGDVDADAGAEVEPGDAADGEAPAADDAAE
jgi:DNA gyrase subunit A